jgi:TolB protein
LFAFTLFVTLCPGTFAFAQPAPALYSDRASFADAASDLTVIDFEGLAPNSGFTQYKREGKLSTAGMEFRPGGGGRFGAGFVVVAGAWYQAGPIYETTTGAKLIWAPPNQPGDVYLDITLPGGVTAVGTDLWTAQPYVSSVEVVINAGGGGSRTATINTPQRPAGAFVGFTSDKPITSLRFALPRGQTGLVIDNFTFGRKAKGGAQTPAGVVVQQQTTAGEQKGATQASSASQAAYASRPSSASEPAPRPTTPPQTEGARTQTVQELHPAAPSRGGTIAYVRGSTEIRLIAPDGTNDRRLWTHPDLTEEIGIFGVAWRPDGKELAFSSGHAAAYSLYHADLYALRPDGTGLRKLTNPPDRTEFARYPKGSVSVTVSNDQPIFQQTHASAGIFLVYVAGAAEPQQITLPPGSTKTLLFNNVADFGNHAQAVVAMWGKYRWFMPGLDVQAGRTVKAPAFSITGDGIDLFGAFRPVWRSDGSRLSYRTGYCTLDTAPANPVAGEFAYNPLFGGKNPLGTCAWDWGPTAATANQIIYTENASGDSSVYRIAEGGTHPGAKLTTYSDIEYQLLSDLRWLPDGSGFLFSNVTLMRDSADIFKYDFSTKRVTQLTHLENEFARAFSISPDGQRVVFERSKTYEEDKDCDLWVMGVDGTGLRLLVRNGLRPSWGK